MTGTQYRDTRKAMGLNQERLAKQLGTTRQAIARRETAALVSKEAEIAILALKADHDRLAGNAGGKETL